MSNEYWANLPMRTIQIQEYGCLSIWPRQWIYFNPNNKQFMRNPGVTFNPKQRNNSTRNNSNKKQYKYIYPWVSFNPEFEKE